MKNFFSVLLLTAGAVAQDAVAAEWQDDSGVLSDMMGGNAMDTGIVGSDIVQGAGGIVDIDPSTGQEASKAGQIMDKSGAGNLIMRIDVPESYTAAGASFTTAGCDCNNGPSPGCGCPPVASCGKCMKLVRVNKCEDKKGFNNYTTNKIENYQKKVATVNHKRVYKTETKLEKRWKTITIPVTKLLRKTRTEWKTKIVTVQEPVEFEVELEKEMPMASIPSGCNCCAPKCGCSGKSGCGCCSQSCQSTCKAPAAPTGPVRRTVMTTKTVRRMMPKQKEIKEEVTIPYFQRFTKMETKRIEIVVPVTKRVPVIVKEEGFKFVPAQRQVTVNHQVPYTTKECFEEMVEQPQENCSCN